MSRIATLMVVMALVLAACGGESADTTSPDVTQPPVTVDTTLPPVTEPLQPEPEPEPEPEPKGPVGVSAYLMREQIAGVFLAPLYRELAPGESLDVYAAIDMLLKGETFTEADVGFGTEIPRETRVIDVDVDDGIAVINLTEEIDDGGGTMTMRARLAQLVFTATQVPEVEAVRLAIEGEPVDVFSSEGIDTSEPMTRDRFLDLCPAVMIEHPATGERVSNEFVVEGSMAPPANRWTLAVVDWDGLIIYEKERAEGADAGDWTDFEWTVTLDPTGVRMHPADFYDLTLMMWQGDFGWGQGTVEIPLFYEVPDIELRDADRAEVTLQPGQHLAVILPGNPTTGFTWAVHSMYMPVLELMKAPYFEPSSELVGAGGEFCFQFEAVQPGTVVLEFHYERVFEDEPPEETATVTVTVN